MDAGGAGSSGQTCAPGAPAVIATNQSTPGAIAVDDRHVYWAVETAPDAAPSMDPNNGAVMVAAKDAC